MKHLFVTGTDTGVGKTYFCRLLLEALRAKGSQAVGYKPVCCGDRADAEHLLAASDPAATLNEVNPLWLRLPTAPLTAALIENRPINPVRLREAAENLASRFDHVIVEGAGGWHVPVTDTWFLSDLAAELGWPVLILVGNRLGAINHALLTLQVIQSKGLECLGFVINNLQNQSDPATLTNAGILASLQAAPVLGELSFEETNLPETLFAALTRPS